MSDLLINPPLAAGSNLCCPICMVELCTVDRQGVEIDYCPQCRGVWLDRGELEKLITRSDAACLETEAALAPDKAAFIAPSNQAEKPYNSEKRYDLGGSPTQDSFLRAMFDFPESCATPESK